MKIPEGIYRLEEPGMAAFLFSGRREVMADACLQGMMGCVYGRKESRAENGDPGKQE